MEENERKEKSNKLFDKGMECYNNQQYKEALKYFEASIKFYKNDRAELFIGVCKNNIPEDNSTKTNNNSYFNFNSNNTSNNNYHKAYSYSKPSSSSSNNSSSRKNTSSSSSSNYTKNKSYSSDNVGDNSEDKLCKELLKKKDYYDILNLKKDATQDEIKRGYKKQAVKFHPDKNQSKLAEECFKKISEAYQCLSNPEKKSFYDKYGNEEEFKAKYYEANHRYYEEEVNPFEAFNMFFGNGFFPNARRMHYYYSNDNNTNEGQVGNRRTILQFFPVLILLLVYILPNLSYLFESKPLYQFTRNSAYNHKRRTTRNGVVFYVGDKFIKKYPKMKDFKFLEPTIEKEYLGFLYEDCSSVINYKNRLQYYMSVTYSDYQKNQYKRQLDQLNFSSCHKYNSLVNLIR